MHVPINYGYNLAVAVAVPVEFRSFIETVDQYTVRTEVSLDCFLTTCTRLRNFLEVRMSPDRSAL